MTRLVALTGATGFIGRHLTTGLARVGLRVRALSRRAPPVDQPDTDVEWVRGDLGDSDALAELVRDADAVVHCGGAVRGASSDVFEEVNALGTERLAAAAVAQAPSTRFLLISSLAAREPKLSWYAASKRRGEELLAQRASPILPFAVFRPTAVYGEGDREMLPLFQIMRRGILPVLGPQEARLTLLHVEDLVSAVVAWVQHGEPVRGTFELHDGTPGGYTWPLIARTAEEAWSRKIRCVPIPKSLLHLLSGVTVGVGRMTGRPPMLTPGKVRELRHPDWVCDNAPLTEALGWVPQVDLSLALRTRRPFVR